MSLSNWDAGCWALGALGFLVLSVVLLMKKRYAAFPWFTGLLIFQMTQTVTLFLVRKYGDQRSYFSTYWGGEIIETVIRVGVFFELTRIASRLLERSEHNLVRKLRYAIAVAGGLCFWIMRSMDPLSDPVINVATKIGVCTSTLLAVLAVTIFLLTFFSGLKLRVHSQAVIYGLFLYCISKALLQISLLSADPDLYLTCLDYIKLIYIACLYVWAWVFWFDEPKQVLNDEMETFRQASIRLDNVVSIASLKRFISDFE